MANIFSRFGSSQAMKRWTRAMQRPDSILTRDLTSMYGDMRAMRDQIDNLAADARTELHNRIRSDDGITRPEQCDWAERASPWRSLLRPRGHVDVSSPLQISEGVTLFHDAPHSGPSLRQEPAPAGLSGPDFGLVLEVYRFDGSFISIVQDLPEAALRGLTLNHYYAVELEVSREQPLEIYARLNVQHGPNQEQIVRQFDFDGDRARAEFDLAYSKINEKRIEKAWLDIILESPEMNRIAIWDMVMLRAPRADI